MERPFALLRARCTSWCILWTQSVRCCMCTATSCGEATESKVATRPDIIFKFCETSNAVPLLLLPSPAPANPEPSAESPFADTCFPCSKILSESSANGREGNLAQELLCEGGVGGTSGKVPAERRCNSCNLFAKIRAWR